MNPLWDYILLYDVSRLMEIIRNLQRLGNTIVIVEHDREVILSADHIIDLGTWCR